jgi:hypothetical protein
MNAYVAIGIAVAGWVATHILTLRAQAKTLRLQVLDRARNEITRELRAAQAWCGKVVTMVMMATTNLEFESRGPASIGNTRPSRPSNCSGLVNRTVAELLEKGSQTFVRGSR